MSLHADVAVRARDRNRLERLCRYVARPPLALDRLEATADGRLAYRLKTRWRDGTTHIVMERHELLERLAPLVPPPRAHQIRYHGVLAPCASGRDRIVPSAIGRVEDLTKASGGSSHSPTSEIAPPVEPAPALHGSDVRALSSLEAAVEIAAAAPNGDSVRRFGAARDAFLGESPGRGKPAPRHHIPWAELLRRVFELDALCCPKCGGRMRVLSAITELIAAARILRCLALPARAPPLAPAREKVGLPDSVGELASEANPEFDFDQSWPSDDGERSV